MNSGITRLVVAVCSAGALALTGCVGSDSVSTGDFGAQDLAECRLLGGGWRYVEHRKDGSSMSTVRHGNNDGELGMPSGKRLRRSRARAAANGWDEEAIDTLLRLPDDNEMARNFGFEGSDAELDALRQRFRDRLEAMPTCDE
ncbi:MAG TPA: hypothetical protein VM307_15905 [Egibacteraceae bacterium]|nr:hypothetical protein [Egibacteraceae bacterium]